MKKGKVIIWIIIIIIIIGLIILFINKNNYDKTTPLFERKEYKNIELKDIQKITINKYLESGSESIEETEPKDIKATYNYLKSLRVGKESKTACDDNTTVYVIELKKDVLSVEIECDNFVINNKRYQIKK